MAMPATPGPLVDDAEDAYRAILYPWQWVEHLGRPSSAALDEEVFSVDIVSRTTPNKRGIGFTSCWNSWYSTAAMRGASVLRHATSWIRSILTTVHMPTSIFFVIKT